MLEKIRGILIEKIKSGSVDLFGPNSRRQFGNVAKELGISTEFLNNEAVTVIAELMQERFNLTGVRIETVKLS